MDGGDEVSIVTFVYPRVSSMGYFSSFGSSSKPSHPSLPVSVVARYIQEYFRNKKRGRKRKFIKPQQDKARNRGFTEIGCVPKSRVIFKNNRGCPFCFFFVL